MSGLVAWDLSRIVENVGKRLTFVGDLGGVIEMLNAFFGIVAETSEYVRLLRNLPD